MDLWDTEYRYQELKGHMSPEGTLEAEVAGETKTRTADSRSNEHEKWQRGDEHKVPR